MQWHPTFAHLLRTVLAEYYEVLTNLAVGDLPREADLVVLRRTAPAPFVGIWRHLTPWNVLEFKGPTDDPGLRDIDLLLEVGLGIDRRLNEDRQKQGEPVLPRQEVSWWYLANHIGWRFRAEVEAVLGQVLEKLQEGLWRCPALGHVMFLVSRDVLPVERESVPLHLVTLETLERQRALAREVAQPGFWELYSSFLAAFHSNVWEEAQQMIRNLGMEPTLDLRPLIKLVGLKQVIDQVGLKQVIDQIDIKQVIDEVGLKQIIDLVGFKQVIETVGPEQFLTTMGSDWLLSRLTPEELQHLLLSRLTPEQLQELERQLP